MSHSPSNRFRRSEGSEVFTGNELILKGALEGGAALMTGYPGSPVSEVFDVIAPVTPLLDEMGVVAQLANNEGLAAARMNGARLAGLRSIAIMKSVGMHVAADGLAIGNLSETKRPEGGSLVVVGDDPWNETTQINSDSRFLSQHLHMPILEPSTFQEVKDWIKDGFELSGISDLYLTYIVTTNQADGGGTVMCRPNIVPAVNARHKGTLASDKMPVEQLVMIPPHTSYREATLPSRFERLLADARKRGLNKILWPSAPRERYKVGFVSAGLSFCYLSQALELLGAEDAFPILKWGVTFPLDESLLMEFSRRVDHIVVVEEKRDFLEGQISRLFKRLEQDGRLPKPPALWGKRFPDEKEGLPEARGLNASVLVERLGPLLKSQIFQAALPAGETVAAAIGRVKSTEREPLNLPIRTPTFCPGCPHRDSSSVTKAIKRDFMDPDYMRRVYKSEPMDVIFHGESGCHSMLQFKPYVGLMQDYSGMGLGGGTGAGLSPFVTNKQVVFLGDSTFFHSGLIAVSDSLKNNQDITYIILQNGTTAMTGHQPTPGAEKDVMGRPTFAQDIESVLNGMTRGSSPVVRVNPEERSSYRALVESTILKPGVKVIIADKECAITYQRRLRREKKKLVKAKGFLPVERVINITPEVCEDCRECTSATGCPGLAVEETLHGPKITTDRSLCVADGACARVKACPSFEEIVIRRRAASPLPSLPVTAVPPVASRSFDDLWFCYTAGVGGMGSGVVTAVLVQAGRKEGYHVLFADKKGLAIRNGGVYGHVVYAKRERPMPPLVPYGRADLLLGIDLLEAARGLDPKTNLRVASPDRTAAVVNTHKMPTVGTLLGEEDFSAEAIETLFRQNTRSEDALFLDFARISEEYFGHVLYGNVIMLGSAFQRGLLPLAWESLEEGVRQAVPPADIEENLKALDLGRRAATRPDLFRRFSPQKPTYWETLQDKMELLRKNRPVLGRRLASAYHKMVEEAARWIDLEDRDRARLAQYVYDVLMFGGLSHAKKYLQRLWAVYQRDTAGQGYAAARAVLENLARVMVIKDEVYVAHLLTSHEKYRRDRERYHLDPVRGDKAEYIHLNRPRFVVFGKTIEFDLKSRDWQLRIMRHLRFLRHLLPQWHAEEKAFRSWYENVVDGFHRLTDPEAYRLYVELLRLPENVKGYREIRHPKMESAYRRAREIQQSLADLGTPPSGARERVPSKS
jgi:indolepyruvate ferredoxin oxidoreductase